MEQSKIRSFRKNLRRFERLNQLLNNSCCKGITLAQCHVLLEIEELGEATTIQLAKNLMLDKSTLSRTVDKLVERGLVQRKQHPTDRRFITLVLKKEGMKTCGEINQANDNTYTNILSNLTENEADEILKNFEQLVQILSDFNLNENPKDNCCN
jgi:DNA-binding MarR family transcriptional regulator